MAGDITVTLLRIIGIMLGSFLVMMVLAVAFLQLYVRRAAANKIYAIFLDNKRLFSAMLSIEGDSIYYGKGEKKEKYLLDTTRQFWATWPSVGGRWIGTSVRAHWYVRNNPQPLDPTGKSTGLTARSLNMIGDEAMLKTTWKDIRETAGLTARARSSTTTLLLIGLAILGGFNLYLIMNLQKVLDTIAGIVGVK